MSNVESFSPLPLHTYIFYVKSVCGLCCGGGAFLSQSQDPQSESFSVQGFSLHLGRSGVAKNALGARFSPSISHLYSAPPAHLLPSAALVSGFLEFLLSLGGTLPSFLGPVPHRAVELDMIVFLSGTPEVPASSLVLGSSRDQQK